nr:MAG TPA: hypothetical protein [Herelleviridae sp.]
MVIGHGLCFRHAPFLTFRSLVIFIESCVIVRVVR